MSSITRWAMATSTAAACSLGLAAQAAPAQFAAPVRIDAGGKVAGHERMYPSPAFHDVNRDGRADLVVGDLRGIVTVALRNKDGSFDAEQPLKDRRGEQLKFSNW